MKWEVLHDNAGHILIVVVLVEVVLINGSVFLENLVVRNLYKQFWLVSVQKATRKITLIIDCKQDC